MNKIKKAIVKEYRGFHEFIDWEDGEIERFMFYQKGSLRLTQDGYRILKKDFENHLFKYEEELMSKHLGAITKQFTLPYYLSQKKLVVFSDSDAMLISLSGNLKKYFDTQVIKKVD